MDHILQQQAISLERLKQIQKSNKHVNNLIQNAKKIIYNQQQLSSNQKQILQVFLNQITQVKISIEKNHLKNVFCKIECPDDEFRVQIVRKDVHENQNIPNEKNQYKKFYHKEAHTRNQIQEQVRLKKEKNEEDSYYYLQERQQIKQMQHRKQQDYQQSKKQQLSREPDTKITISRYAKQKPDHDEKQQKTSKRLVSVCQNRQSNQYEIDLSDKNIHQTVLIKPSNISKVVVNTQAERLQDQNQNFMAKSYLVRKDNLYPNEQYRPSFSNYRKQKQQALNEQLSEKSSDILEEYSSQLYQDQISISTPNNQFQVISTKTQQRLFVKPMNSSHVSQNKKSPKTQLINFSKIQPKVTSSYEHYKQKNNLPNSQPSTSYKEILSKNKQKLQNSREKLTPYHQTPKTAKSNSYELHIDKLFKKKSQSKRRLYGPAIEGSPKTQKNSLSSTAKKYYIADSHKLGSKTTNQKNQNNSSRKSLSINKNFTQPLSCTSSARKSPLHTINLKSYHLPCSQCIKCNKFSSSKEPKQAFQQFYLAKKYLTPQGQQECYNFLRSQGIPQKDWGSYITEYVYRQLSRVYKDTSPKQSDLNMSEK